jgi:hypothetical protein
MVRHPGEDREFHRGSEVSAARRTYAPVFPLREGTTSVKLTLVMHSTFDPCRLVRQVKQSGKLLHRQAGFSHQPEAPARKALAGASGWCAELPHRGNKRPVSPSLERFADRCSGIRPPSGEAPGGAACARIPGRRPEGGRIPLRTTLPPFANRSSFPNCFTCRCQSLRRPP